MPGVARRPIARGIAFGGSRVVCGFHYRRRRSPPPRGASTLAIPSPNRYRPPHPARVMPRTLAGEFRPPAFFAFRAPAQEIEE
jgi:hypothetical protein